MVNALFFLKETQKKGGVTWKKLAPFKMIKKNGS